jgi:hypothetical protein
MDAPTAAELEAHPVVQAAFAVAWADSLADDPTLRHEEGGFIYANATTGEIVIRRAPPGDRDSIDLSYPPAVSECFLVATYHTHPLPSRRGFDPTPSSHDYELAEGSGVPWFIVSDQGVFVAGPDSRDGGFSGRPGYPY